MYGFADDQWLRGIVVILEKKKGARKIHLLWIIGVLEADVNTALKFFFANQMMIIAEDNGLSDGHHGSRKNQTRTDAAMIKLLTFECARAKKSTIWEVSYDCKAYFDRVGRLQSNIYAQERNMDANLLLTRDLCMEKLQRHVKTGLVVYVVTYQQEKEEP